MAIPPKDQHILWSRAFGRCSQCRRKLVLDASDAVASKATVVGEMCHIVGEKPGSARSESVLSEEERSRYPNLILLCREHHKVVDDDPAQWPIELLHQIKADHELWAESLVADDATQASTSVYAALVNSATENLRLSRWDILTDAAVRNMLHESFVEGVRQFAIDVRKTIWPATKPVLEAALKDLANRAVSYVDRYLELAYLSDRGLFEYDGRWKRNIVPDYDERVALFDQWERDGTRLLFNLTHAINVFASAVRSSLRPTYFLSEGEFYVLDSLGVLTEMEGQVHFVSGYVD